MSPRAAGRRSPLGRGHAPASRPPGCSASWSSGGRFGQADRARCRSPRARSRQLGHRDVPKQVRADRLSERLLRADHDLALDPPTAQGAAEPAEPESATDAAAPRECDRLQSGAVHPEILLGGSTIRVMAADLPTRTPQSISIWNGSFFLRGRVRRKQSPRPCRYMRTRARNFAGLPGATIGSARPALAAAVAPDFDFDELLRATFLVIKPSADSAGMAVLDGQAPRL